METRPDRRISKSFTTFLVTLTSLILSAPMPVSGRGPQNNVLSVRIGMSRDDVHHRLKKIGTLEKEVRGRQEVWKLTREPRFASVMVGFDT